MRTALILNPTAGASQLSRQKMTEGELEAALLQTLRSLDIEAEIYHTTLEDPGLGIARQLVAEHIELIVAVGGDGTIHSVAHGLIGSESVLGIIPAGTMNNLAHCLGIPEELEEACALLTNGEARYIDVGMINGHTFLEVAGIGLEAELFPAAEEVKSRGILSTIKGVTSGLATLIRFRPPLMKVTFNGGKPRTYRAMQLTVCNSPYYGPHMSIAPDILMDDGWLDVVLYRNFSKLEYIQHAISISQGRRTFTPKIIHRRVRSLRVSTNEVVEVQADGVIYGHTPAEISIRANALKVQVPRARVPGLLPAIREQITQKVKGKRRTYA